MQGTPADPLQAPVTVLPGVGPERSSQLARLGITSILDLLLHAPRRHEDRRHLLRIQDLPLGQAATTRGRVVAMGLKRFRQRAQSVFEIVLDDGTARLHCRWWNVPYMEKYFAVGDEVMAYGKLKSAKPRTIDHPETEVIDGGEELLIHIDRLAPIYPLTEGLPQRWLRALLWRTLDRHADTVPDPRHENFPARLPARPAALRQLHFPDSPEQAELARQRLAYDEFFELQLQLQRRRRRLEAGAEPLPCAGDQNRLIRPFLRSLPFQLTDAQTRVLREIRADLGANVPMRRLLQGDVGSGKTAVAACAALMALETGHSAALMAPTEILAHQHHATFQRWFEPLGIPVALHTASRKTTPEPPASPAHPPTPGTEPARKAIHGPALHIGTHALLESSVAIDRLGLVLIDEQHKFGVAQRERLVRKGRYPHLLVMTATPIPRTLGLTLYGDLDCSIIDQLPPGRGIIHTHVRTEAQRPKVIEFIRRQIDAGRQAYVVCPRIEGEDDPAGDKAALRAVLREAAAWTKALAPHAVAVLHGRLATEEKEAVMRSFRANETRVLLATSVIEVGVDVPNATVMCIENADSFGLAQLHQLRGRIGRGAHESHCLLMQSARTDDARARLAVMAATTDGFRLAEEDLRLRGPGELLGQQQSGLPALRFGDLVRDREWIELARTAAREVTRRESEPKPLPTAARPGSAPAEVTQR